MNTSAVSKLLGVSASTVQRWVKQLGLEMERNELGHYLYSDEDVEILKEFKQQVQNGIPMQEIKLKKKTRRGSMKLQKEVGNERILERIRDLEKNLNKKADSVVSYQLLQHRQEIEDLKAQVDTLQKQLDHFSAATIEKLDKKEQTVPDNEIAKPTKKTIFRSFFGF